MGPPASPALSGDTPAALNKAQGGWDQPVGLPASPRVLEGSHTTPHPWPLPPGPVTSLGSAAQSVRQHVLGPLAPDVAPTLPHVAGERGGPAPELARPGPRWEEGPRGPRPPQPEPCPPSSLTSLPAAGPPVLAGWGLRQGEGSSLPVLWPYPHPQSARPARAGTG